MRILGALVFFSFLPAFCLGADPASPTTAVIENKALAVELSQKFPQVICYHDRIGGGIFSGQPDAATKVLLNEKPVECRVVFSKTSDMAAEYALNFPGEHISLSLKVALIDHGVKWQLADIRETGDAKLKTLAFPNNALLSVNSAQRDAALATTFSTNRHDDHRAQFREYVGTVSAKAPGQDTGNYLFLSSGNLAAGIACDNYEDIQRIAWEITEKNGVKTCTAQNPVWQVRAFDDEAPSFPTVQIFIVGDLNNDGVVNWQDAALAYRHAMPKPFSSEFTKEIVGENIAMNFASGAQQPFLSILDALKRCYLVTDGLGQQVIIKGFSSEGHDSANTDYADHFNARAGGLKDFTVLLNEAHKYNARVGIHINATEAYPEALRYKPDILQRDSKNPENFKKGWLWLDQSYMIDKVKDVRSGQLFSALERMKRQIPKLDFVYLDTYWENGWPAWQTAKKINDLGLALYTEGNTPLDPWTTWAHWRGEKHEKGSVIMLYIWFSERDLFPNDSILRGGRDDSDTFLNWQGRFKFQGFVNGTFAGHLPGKFLQHFELLSWRDGQGAVFRDGVKVEKTGDVVSVTQDGCEVMTWDGQCKNQRLFIPWNPHNPEKIYVWDEVGTERTWTLPPTWQDQPTVYLYKLTDLGRIRETVVPVSGGKVALFVERNTPYVLYPAQAPRQALPVFGEGSPVKDPGFDSQGFSDWKRSPDSDAVIVVKDKNDNSLLLIDGGQGAAGQVSQAITGLEPGKTYAATVWVQIKGRREATLEVEVGGNKFSVRLDRTNVRHSAPNDSRTGTNYRRMRVLFDVPSGITAGTLTLKAAAGRPKSAVEFDDVRVVATARSPEAAKHWFWEDFENVESGGYGPFSCCSGERTHLSETNRPYTNDTINGHFSLKSRDGGRVLRTVPPALRFEPNTRYRITCLTQGNGRLAVESRGKTVLDLKFPNQPDFGVGAISGEFVIGNDTEAFLALYKVGGDFITIDDLAIDRLGSVPPVADETEDVLSGRTVIWREVLGNPLDAVWQVTQPGAVKVEGQALKITASANAAAFVSRTLPAGSGAIECRLKNISDEGQTWGPGLALIWEKGPKLRINLRSLDGKFGIDSGVAGQIIAGELDAELVTTLRIRWDDKNVILEARNGTEAWQRIAEFTREKFPGDPKTFSLGKLDGAIGGSSHSEPGPLGVVEYEEAKIYAK